MLRRVPGLFLTLAFSALALVFALFAAAVVLTAGVTAWAWLRWRGERPVRGAQRGVIIEGEYRDETHLEPHLERLSGVNRR